jgi:hypothetical protein
MFTSVIHPFWSANPPDRRLCNKPYKRIGHPTAFVPENSLLFKARRCSCGSPPGRSSAHETLCFNANNVMLGNAANAAVAGMRVYFRDRMHADRIRVCCLIRQCA